MAPLDPTLEEQRRVEAATQRRASPLAFRERVAEALLGGGFAAACLALLAAAPPTAADVHVESLVACALTLAVAVRVRFVVGAGYTVPTQLAFVPLLFVVPPALIAPVVAVVLAAGQLPEVLGGRLPAGRLLLAPANAWFSIGPAIVLALAGTPDATEASAGIVAAVLAAQVTVDAVSGACRELLHGTFDRRAMISEAWIYGVDAALTPVAFVAAIVVAGRSWVVLAMVPLMGILALFSREREARLQGMTELNAAYRGISIVLGDVVEADDGYTGEHCRDVVELALAVGQRLRLPADRMRNLEFGALLHDVGKVAIPKEIINKPGALDAAEWAIVRTHTIEGQRMLDRVGGFMCEVGLIVRGHHERWDGGGYPDGLAGEMIPLEARIVACCDSWNAMTTNRAYRAALPDSVAAEELRANAGSQFDPDVVEAALAVVAPTHAASVSARDAVAA